MARKKRAQKAVRGRRERIERWIGLLVSVFGVYVLVALLTYAHPDHAVSAGPLADVRANAGGQFGQILAGTVAGATGWLVAWLVPLFLLAWGWNRLRISSLGPLALRTLLAVPLSLTLMTVFSALGAGQRWSGTVGLNLWGRVEAWVGPAGGILILLAATFGFLLLEAEALSGRWGVVTRRVGRTLRALARLLGGLVTRSVSALGRRTRDGFTDWRTRRAEQAALREEERIAAEAEALARAEAEETLRAQTAPPLIVGADTGSRNPGSAAAGPTVPTAPRGTASAGGASHPTAPVAAPIPTAEAKASHTATTGTVNGNGTTAAPPPAPLDHGEVKVRKVAEGVVGEDDVGGVLDEAKREARKRGANPKALFDTIRGKFVLPTTDLFDEIPTTGPSVSEEELVRNSNVLTQTLLDFGIQGRVGEVHPGPVITRYEYTPGPGVRVAQIVNRAEDLALKLRAIRIRIVAPIPGKAAVGIEVPNQSPEVIYLRRMVESSQFKEAKGPLTLALGKDINGVPVMAELTKMPHLLVAGTTGSGKSVCMNSIVTSLIMRHSPEDLRMLMIDPKMLELPMYNGIPHLLTDVVTDPRLAARSLKWLIAEMERRYQVLAKRGSRNILSYNEKMEKEGPVEEGEEKLPYIVGLIDELADLMMTSGKEVEEPIARLAQMARAVGIHLIVATQRPSVDVLTGVIKANFPSRIAFQVASKTDSRTILDQNGAETLLGRGDMLFLPPGKAAPERVHGAFVSETETQSLVQFLRDQGDRSADLTLEEALAGNEATGEIDTDDPLFEDAARTVVRVGQGSASMLQRRLKVGYARAGRLMDMLEAAGVVAPAEGSKPRELLLDEVHLEHLLRERDE